MVLEQGQVSGTIRPDDQQARLCRACSALENAMHEVHYQCEVQLVGQDDPTLNIEKLIEIDAPTTTTNKTKMISPSIWLWSKLAPERLAQDFRERVDFQSSCHPLRACRFRLPKPLFDGRSSVMPKKDEYHHASHSSICLKYHFVFACKSSEEVV
jgi:hypothetical protein